MVNVPGWNGYICSAPKLAGTYYAISGVIAKLRNAFQCVYICINRYQYAQLLSFKPKFYVPIPLNSYFIIAY